MPAQAAEASLHCHFMCVPHLEVRDLALDRLVPRPALIAAVPAKRCQQQTSGSRETGKVTTHSCMGSQTMACQLEPEQTAPHIAPAQRPCIPDSVTPAQPAAGPAARLLELPPLLSLPGVCRAASVSVQQGLACCWTERAGECAETCCLPALGSEPQGNKGDPCFDEISKWGSEPR